MKGLSFDDILLVPKYSNIEHRSECDTTSRLTRNYKIEVPIVSAPMDTVTELNMLNRLYSLGAVGSVHRFMSIDDEVKIISRHREINVLPNNPVIGTIGVTGDYYERAVELIKAGANILLLDVAHGHHILVEKAINKIKGDYSVDIIAGNVVTDKAVRDLCTWGADSIRVGIGGGSLCSTRIKTGVGIPQVTAIIDCVQAAEDYDVPVIADGGIRTPGDVAKAIALGAETVMLGSLLAGTDETPGNIQKSIDWPNETLYKKYRGSASLDSKLDRGESNNVEGESTIIPYKGSVKRIITDITDGLRSSMSYLGARNISEFQIKSEFTEITNAGFIESTAHLIKK